MTLYWSLTQVSTEQLKFDNLFDTCKYQQILENTAKY